MENIFEKCGMEHTNSMTVGDVKSVPEYVPEQPWTTYYFIMVEDEKVGAVRVVNKKDGSRKRISPIWIMPQHRNKGYAQKAIKAVEGI